jgi:ABC-type dipeptide/oligopeptide/nickel transport system permease component
MLSYITRRILLIFPILLLVLTVVFLGVRIVPGNPALVILGDRATAQSLAALEEQLGLNKPLWEQYFSYLAGAVTGDLGESIISQRSVTREILRVLPYTIDLIIAGTFISAMIALPVGILSALKQNSVFDYASRVMAFIGITMPSFLLGILILILFGLIWPLFPIMGGGMLSNPGERLYHLALPALSLGLTRGVLLTRATRSSILEVINKEYIVTARSKGLTEKKVFLKHALRNALIPVVTIMGLDVARSFGGGVIIANVFSRPGLGKLLVDAINQHDYPLIQGGVLTLAFLVLLANTTVDILYSVIDPRIKYS